MSTLEERLARLQQSEFQRDIGNSDLESRLSQLTQDQTISVAMQNTPSHQLGERAVRGFVDNVMATPGFIGDLIGQNLASGAAAVNTLGGGLQNFGERFTQERGRQLQKFPASSLTQIPQPKTTDIDAGLGTAGQVLSGQAQGGIGQEFQQQQQNIEEWELSRAEQFPIATTVGDIFGDAATLFTGRAPIQKLMQRRTNPGLGRREEILELNRANRTPENIAEITATPVSQVNRIINQRVAQRAATPPGLRRRIKDVFDRGFGKKLAESGIRTAEAGLESAVIGALNDDDPVTSAAMAAGVQAGSGMVLEANKKLFGKFGNLGSALLAGTALYHMAKESTPGGRDRILESFETTAEKMSALVALGVLSSLAGGGRIKGSIAEDMPIVADGITSIPRGAIQSLARGMFDADPIDREQAYRVILALKRDPDAFGEHVNRRIVRALFSESPRVDFVEEINKIRENNPSFQRQLEELPVFPIEQPPI